MKNKLCIIVLVFIGFSAFAQITVTDAHIPSIGDVFYQATDDASGLINPGIPGPNQTWDFSSLKVNAPIATSHCLSPNGTPHASSYPDANLCMEESGDYLYLHKSANKVELLGEGDSVLQQPR